MKVSYCTYTQASCRQRYRLCQPTEICALFVGQHKALPLLACHLLALVNTNLI